ncbi:MAG: hypothetical protein V3V67_17440 [Myxococcota bacterium]
MVIGAHHQGMIEGFAHPLAATVCLAEQIAHEQGFGLVAGEGERVESVSAVEEACLQSHTNVDRSLPSAVQRAREALGLTDAQMGLIGQETEALRDGLA